MEYQEAPVLIIGVANATGEAVASILAEKGYQNLVLADSNASTLEATKIKLLRRHRDADILTVTLNLGDEAQVGDLLQQASRRFPHLRLFVNCISEQLQPCETTKLDILEYKSVLQRTLKTTWICLRAQIRYAMEALSSDPSGNGVSIVNVASTYGVATDNTAVAQTAVDHGIIGMMKSVALDHIGSNLRINCVCAGPAPAASWKALNTKADEDIDDAENVAQAVAFLLSPDARAINAVALPVDYGWSLYHH